MGQFAETHFAKLGKVYLHCPFRRCFFGKVGIGIRQNGHRNAAEWARRLSTSAETDFLRAKI